MVEGSDTKVSVTRPVRATRKNIMSVYVLDKFGKPLMPCSEKRARLLLERNRARIHRLIPMVIRLVDREATACQ